MFYTEAVLSKQGPLARIWLAAHWDKKLTKNVVVETDLENACDSVVNPSVKLALRTSGHLLLGVVRIYNRKTRYLLADCNEAFMKIKLAFRTGMTIDLPADERGGGKNQIFLPDDLDLELTVLPEISQNELQSAMLRNTARIEEITRKHDVRNLQHSGIFRDLLRNNDYEDDDFGLGTNFDEWESESNIGDHSIQKGRENMSTSKNVSRLSKASRADKDEMDLDVMAELNEVGEDDLGDIFGGDVLEDEEAPMPPGNNDDNQMDVTPMLDATNQKSGFDNISKIRSPGIQNPEIEDMDDMMDAGSPLGAADDIVDMAPPTPAEYLPPPTPGMPMDEMPPTPGFAMPPTPGMPMTPGMPESSMMPVGQHGNHLVNSQNLLNLDSVHSSEMAPAPHRQPRVRKKRKLLVDGMMEITNSMMKSQLKDYSDIVLPVDTNYDWLAPPTIRLVQWKEHGTTEPLFKHNFVGDRNREKQEYLSNLQYATSNAQPQRNSSYDEFGKSKKSPINRKRNASKDNTIQPGTPEKSTMNQTNQDTTMPPPAITPFPPPQENVDPNNVMASTPANPMPPPSVPDISAIQENSINEKLSNEKSVNHDNEPEAKRSRPNDVTNPLETTELNGTNLMPPPPAPVDEFSINLTKDGNSHLDLMPESVNPMSVAPPSVMPLSPLPPLQETKSLEETFSHIHYKDLDDDKKRDGCMMQMIEADMGRLESEDAGFFDISNGQDRKRAARQFYSLLVLRKTKIIEVEQSGPCEDIRVFKNENWGNADQFLMS